MPRRQDIDSVLIIGAGPIVIGQACEFDYSEPRPARRSRKKVSRHPDQFEPGHHHDRPGYGRRRLHRADHLAGGRKNHRKGKAAGSVAHHGWADRAQLCARPGARRGAGKTRRGNDRRHARSHRYGRGSRTVSCGDGRDWPENAEGLYCAQPRGSLAGTVARSDFRSSFGLHSPWVAAVAALPTTEKNSRTLFAVAWTCRRPPRY